MASVHLNSPFMENETVEEEGTKLQLPQAIPMLPSLGHHHHRQSIDETDELNFQTDGGQLGLGLGVSDSSSKPVSHQQPFLMNSGPGDVNDYHVASPPNEETAQVLGVAPAIAPPPCLDVDGDDLEGFLDSVGYEQTPTGEDQATKPQSLPTPTGVYRNLNLPQGSVAGPPSIDASAIAAVRHEKGRQAKKAREKAMMRKKVLHEQQKLDARVQQQQRPPPPSYQHVAQQVTQLPSGLILAASQPQPQYIPVMGQASAPGPQHAMQMQLVPSTTAQLSGMPTQQAQPQPQPLPTSVLGAPNPNARPQQPTLSTLPPQGYLAPNGQQVALQLLPSTEPQLPAQAQAQLHQQPQLLSQPQPQAQPQPQQPSPPLQQQQPQPQLLPVAPGGSNIQYVQYVIGQDGQPVQIVHLAPPTQTTTTPQ